MDKQLLQSKLRSTIRTVSHWPKPDVQFRDITPLFLSPELMEAVITHFVERYRGQKLDAVAGIEARGFVFAAVLAHALNLAFIPIRKKGKLPFKTLAENYELEYGTAAVEIHVDACKTGDRILLVDDLIATGGTLLAAKMLFQRMGAEVIEAAVVIDLPELNGSKKCRACALPVYSLIQFEGQ